MKKVFFILILVFVCSFNSVFAVTTADTSPEALLERFKTHRSVLYGYLSLSDSQMDEIEKLDNNIYKELTPELEQISVYIKRIDEIASSDDCTVESVNLVKKDFRATEKNISVIKHKYEKDFKKILDREQIRIYKAAKKEQRIKLKKEMELLKNNEKS